MYKLKIISIKTSYRNHSKTLFLVGILFMFSCTDNDDSYSLKPIVTFPEREQDFSLWQLDQFFQEVQMGYIIRTDDNKITVIDGGGLRSAPIVEEYLIQFGGKVDTWIVTHPHSDHIGVLLKVIENKRIVINKILHSALEDDWVRMHEPTAYDIVVNYNRVLKKTQIKIVDVQIGDTFILGEGVEMKVIGIRNSNIFVNAINNSSLVFRIKSKSKSVLFLGDLGVEGGDVLLNGQNTIELKANYVQVAHHGQNGVNKKFYEAVKAEYALWPTPKWLWDNFSEGEKIYLTGETAFVVHQWMDDLHVKENHVAGIEGTTQID